MHDVYIDKRFPTARQTDAGLDVEAALAHISREEPVFEQVLRMELNDNTGACTNKVIGEVIGVDERKAGRIKQRAESVLRQLLESYEPRV